MRIHAPVRLECGGDHLLDQPTITSGAQSPTKVLDRRRVEPVGGGNEQLDDERDDVRVRPEGQIAFLGRRREDVRAMSEYAVGWVSLHQPPTYRFARRLRRSRSSVRATRRR